MKENYWELYRCPECDYESITTNVCRDCMRNMYATGKETGFNKRKRKLREGTKNFERALSWNKLQFQSDKLSGRTSPLWAFGIQEVIHVEH